MSQTQSLKTLQFKIFCFLRTLQTSDYYAERGSEAQPGSIGWLWHTLENNEKARPILDSKSPRPQPVLIYEEATSIRPKGLILIEL
jgi:hypothetical protein